MYLSIYAVVPKHMSKVWDGKIINAISGSSEKFFKGVLECLPYVPLTV